MKEKTKNLSKETKKKAIYLHKKQLKENIKKINKSFESIKQGKVVSSATGNTSLQSSKSSTNNSTNNSNSTNTNTNTNTNASNQKNSNEKSKKSWKSKLQETKSNSINNDPKILKKKRKSMKSNFTLIEEVKSIWNQIRMKKIPLEEKQKLIQILITKLTGNIVRVALRHDASRIIQTIIQFGNTSQRQIVLNELAPKLPEIAKTPYGHFAGLKAIDICKEISEQRKISLAIKAHFVSLGTNVIGARTVELILQKFPSKYTRELKSEFYGHKYTILMSEIAKSLHDVITSLPSKESPILDHMRDLIQKFVDKGLLEFAYVHHLLWEYVREVMNKPKRMTDFISLVIDHIPKLMSTKPGSKTCCIIITYSIAKDRKRIIKSLKGNILSSLLHDSAHLVIMCLIDVTDDTVNIQKSILDEIKSLYPINIKYTATGEVIGIPLPPLILIAKHRFGRKFLLRLLAPMKTFQHLEPDESILFNSSNTSIQTSKKLPEIRRKENLLYLKSSIIHLFTKYAKDLLRCRYGSKVLEEVINTFYPLKLMNILSQIYAGVEVDEIELDVHEDMNEEEELEELEEDEQDYEDEEEVVDEDEVETIPDDEYWEEEKQFEEDLPIVTFQNNQNGEDENMNTSSIEHEILPIQEDPIAHVVLKSIIKLEEDITIDKTFWDDNSLEEKFCVKLVSLLKLHGSIIDWLTCNRPCLILAEMIKISSCLPLVLSLLEEHHESMVTISMKHHGGKVLYDLYLKQKTSSNENLKDGLKKKRLMKSSNEILKKKKC